MDEDCKGCQLSKGCQLARAYVPFQEMNEIFNQCEALKRGTLFTELYMPYSPSDNEGGYYNG